MTKRMKLDADEKKLLTAVDRGESKSGGDGKRERAHYALRLRLPIGR